MLDGARPILIVQKVLPLIEDRDERKKRRMKRGEVWQIQTAVQSCQGPIRDVMDVQRVNHIDAEMQNTELIDHAANLVQHDHVVGQGNPHGRIEAQCDFAPAREFG